jgi:hypothetical protein
LQRVVEEAVIGEHVIAVVTPRQPLARSERACSLLSVPFAVWVIYVASAGAPVPLMVTETAPPPSSVTVPLVKEIELTPLTLGILSFSLTVRDAPPPACPSIF